MGPSDLDMVGDVAPALPSGGAGKKGRFPRDLWGAVGESFRNLRTALRGAQPGEPRRVLLVTSAVPREGKTTVAVHLARSLAAAGKRVLLVDADLRRPDLHAIFGVEQAIGVSEVAQGRWALQDAVAETDVDGLFVLTAGARASAPAELIESMGFQRMLFAATEQYDAVVLDSAPLVSIADTLILARYVDGILLVVGGLVTPREVVKGALEQIQDRPVLGVVLNGISTPKKYGYYY